MIYKLKIILFKEIIQIKLLKLKTKIRLNLEKYLFVQIQDLKKCFNLFMKINNLIKKILATNQRKSERQFKDGQFLKKKDKILYILNNMFNFKTN